MATMMASVGSQRYTLASSRAGRVPRQGPVRKLKVIARAQSKLPEQSTLEAWYMNDDEKADQRTERRRAPNKDATQRLEELGVLSWKLDADNYATDPDLDAIRKDRGYTYDDIIDVSPDKIPDYETKIVKFFGEHLHGAEEIRLILNGSGYFDVRDSEDEWIRIDTQKGDLIILPEGIYHRFTLDSNNLFKAMRFFKGQPDWTNFMRPSDDHPSREKYLEDREKYIMEYGAS